MIDAASTVARAELPTSRPPGRSSPTRRCSATGARSPPSSRTTSAPPTASSSRREYLRHPGAVGIIALDDEDRVVLVRQYRHAGPAPAARAAGRAAGRRRARTPLAAAQRELAEEVGLAADDLARAGRPVHHARASSASRLRIYLARDLTAVDRAGRLREARRGGRHGHRLGSRSTTWSTPCWPAGCTTRRGQRCAGRRAARAGRLRPPAAGRRAVADRRDRALGERLWTGVHSDGEAARDGTRGRPTECEGDG